MGGELRGMGTGRSKKDAEQDAARNAWDLLQAGEAVEVVEADAGVEVADA